jgi:hypothetical protein
MERVYKITNASVFQRFTLQKRMQSVHQAEDMLGQAIYFQDGFKFLKKERNDPCLISGTC